MNDWVYKYMNGDILVYDWGYWCMTGCISV